MFKVTFFLKKGSFVDPITMNDYFHFLFNKRGPKIPYFLSLACHMQCFTSGMTYISRLFGKQPVKNILGWSKRLSVQLKLEKPDFFTTSGASR